LYGCKTVSRTEYRLRAIRRILDIRIKKAASRGLQNLYSSNQGKLNGWNRQYACGSDEKSR
jgi:hypothetical protein